MESDEVNILSLFDYIESTKEKPEAFSWIQKDIFEKEEIVLENNLALAPMYEDFRKCTLTIRGMILEGIGMLPFKNPRIEPLSDIMGEGFRLYGYNGRYEFYCETHESKEIWLKTLARFTIQRGISSKFEFGKLLGKGSFARVHLAQTKNEEKTKYAIKIIDKAKLLVSRRSLESIEREIDLLRKINHPNIMKLYEVFENNKSLFLVLEYLPGGELMKRLRTSGIYTEKEASSAMKNVLEALLYCHSRNIIHRDLKPDNLIQVSTSMMSEVKIADFGLSTQFRPGILEKLRCGSPGFVAPEVLNDLGYGTQADIFSLGVIMCIMLTGIAPFYGTTESC